MATIRQQWESPLPRESGLAAAVGPRVPASSCNMLQVPMPIKSQLGPFCQHFIMQLLTQMMTESFGFGFSFGKTNYAINRR